MKQYRTVNNLVGWITFLIAATVYCMTIEPTASFWDCPEFITTGYKLEVGHPPGAPFFMLVANLFSQFASDPSTVAKMVNYMSALMSGACILFLFWSITHLVRKLVVTDENNITRGQLITIMGSGLVGALAYTFSDTFWFSAVEGEVYGLVLTGKYVMSTTDNTIPGKQTLVLVLKVEGAQNETKIKPEFKFWLEGNEDEEKYTISNVQDVTVSATPRYNVELLRNIDLAKEITLNENGKSQTGRLYGYALTYQLYNDGDVSKRLKGIEYPEGDIRLDIKLKLEKISIEKSK